MKKNFRPSAVAALIAAALGVGVAGPAAADTTFKLSGFGTLGATMTDNDDTGFRTAVSQQKGAGKTPDLGTDSKLGLQGTADFGSGFSATAQLLGMRSGTEEFDVGFEWLYAQYTGIDGLDLKAGRVVLPSFLVSDSRQVGYAVPWLRVPPLVYAMMPLSHLDGAQVTYRHSVGSAVASVQFTRGSAKAPNYGSKVIPQLGNITIPTISDGASDNVLGMNAMLEWGDWTGRISQVTANDTIDIKGVFPSYLGPFGGLQPLAVLKFKDKFREVGVQYDDGKLVVAAEYVTRTTKSPKVQDASAWYVAAGYRFDALMPYLLVSQYKESFTLGQDGVSAGPRPPKTNGLALGARYDFATNLALKAEVAQYKNNSLYVFTDATSDGVANKKINVLSVTLDFVF